APLTRERDPGPLLFDRLGSRRKAYERHLVAREQEFDREQRAVGSSQNQDVVIRHVRSSTIPGQGGSSRFARRVGTTLWGKAACRNAWLSGVKIIACDTLRL